MYRRMLQLPEKRSFFLFGARNTGKSTLLGVDFSPESSIWFDLLDPEVEDRLIRNPNDFFDTGVTRALARMLTVDLVPSTHAYGNAFEHFIINECIRLNDYFECDYRFSYLRTKADLEIDLIVDRPGKPLCLIEIKSATQVTEAMLSKFIKLSSEFEAAEVMCFSQDPYAKNYQHVSVLPWQEGLRQLFA